MSSRRIMKIEEVVKCFEKKFAFLRDKFVIYNLPIGEIRGSQEEHVWKPGVYVFWTPSEGVIKVGRHLTNSRKRALEHIQDNTGGRMRSIGSDPGDCLLLFNVKNEKEDMHWVAALEIFFELNLDPKIRSERLG